MNYQGFEITTARPTGGKAGRGHNKTSTVQAREPLFGSDYLLRAQFRYRLADPRGEAAAMEKAIAWVENATCK